MKRLLILAALCFYPIEAKAVIFDFTGVINYNFNSGPSVDIGSSFYGWADIDLATPVVDDPFALPGTYIQTFQGFALFTGDKSAVWNDSGTFMTQVDDGTTRDALTVINGVLFDNGQPGEFAMGFWGGNGSVITDRSMSNLRRVNQFENKVISFETYRSGWSFQGNFTSFEERLDMFTPESDNPVPEPSSIALIFVGMLFIKRKLYD